MESYESNFQIIRLSEGAGVDRTKLGTQLLHLWRMERKGGLSRIRWLSVPGATWSWEASGWRTASYCHRSEAKSWLYLL